MIYPITWLLLLRQRQILLASIHHEFPWSRVQCATKACISENAQPTPQYLIEIRKSILETRLQYARRCRRWNRVQWSDILITHRPCSPIRVAFDRGHGLEVVVNGLSVCVRIVLTRMNPLPVYLKEECANIHPAAYP